MTDKERRQRVIALGIMRRPDGRILLEQGTDRVKGEVFYRPLGGGVEFGEYAVDTIKREFAEELDIPVNVRGQISVIENIFVYEDQPDHQITFVMDVAPIESAFYEIENPQRIDKPQHRACWRSIAEIEAEGCPLYPAGLSELLA